MTASRTCRNATKALADCNAKAVKAIDEAFGSLTAAAVIATPWAWLDHKSDLDKAFDALTNSACKTLRETTGHRRHDLVEAIHTLVVSACVIAVLRDHLGPIYRKNVPSAQQKKGLQVTDA